MQMKDPYLDHEGNPDPHHHGEWMMEPGDLKKVFDAYWDADWQIHIHVNGDLGLEVVLDVIEKCAEARTPHRPQDRDRAFRQFDRGASRPHRTAGGDRVGQSVLSSRFCGTSTVSGVLVRSAPTQWCVRRRYFVAVFHCRSIPTCQCCSS